MAGTTPTLELRDIHLPEPISWWPPAPGWWMIIAALLFIALAVFLLRRYQKKQALKKQVLAEFESIRAQFNQEKNSTVLVQSLSILLRRACISFYPRSEVASLTGDAWLQFLDDTGSDKAFHSKQSQIITTAPYLSEKTTLDFDTEKLISLCHGWIKAQPNKNHSSTGSRL